MYESSDGFLVNHDEPPRAYTGMNSVILSQQASRFWIPFDVKLFETLTPVEYLEKYCRVNNRRHTLYKRVFDKYKDSEGELSVKNLPDALSDAYMRTIDSFFVTKVINLLELPSDSKINFAQYQGIAAFSERYFFKKFTRYDNTEPQLQKEILERLDFSTLNWKLVGVNISPVIRQILDNL